MLFLISLFFSFFLFSVGNIICYGVSGLRVFL